MLFPGTMKMPMKTTNAIFGILTSLTSRTSATTEPVPGRKPVLALLTRLLWAAALALPAFSAQAGAVLTTLYSFTGGNDGGGPHAALVQGNDGNFYGTTSGGGTNNSGTVFKISANGALTSLYSFTGGNDDGSPLAALVQGTDGSFYGTTSSFFPGNLRSYGTVFRLTIVPEFQAVTLTNGTLSLTWSTEAGGTYQLQYTSDLRSSNWTNLGSAVTATGATLSAIDSLTNGPRRFYRVVLAP